MWVEKQSIGERNASGMAVTRPNTAMQKRTLRKINRNKPDVSATFLSQGATAGTTFVTSADLSDHDLSEQTHSYHHIPC